MHVCQVWKRNESVKVFLHRHVACPMMDGRCHSCKSAAWDIPIGITKARMSLVARLASRLFKGTCCAEELRMQWFACDATTWNDIDRFVSYLMNSWVFSACMWYMIIPYHSKHHIQHLRFCPSVWLPGFCVTYPPVQRDIAARLDSNYTDGIFFISLCVSCDWRPSRQLCCCLKTAAFSTLHFKCTMVSDLHESLNEAWKPVTSCYRCLPPKCLSFIFYMSINFILLSPNCISPYSKRLTC